jgi:hypothetical protein
MLALLLALSGCGQWRAGRYNRAHGVISLDALRQQSPWVDHALPDWNLTVDYSGGSLPGYSALAGYPVGNGYVFGATGMAYPLGTLEDLFGPTYDKGTAGYGQIVPALEVGGKVVPWQKQVTEWAAPGVVRTTSWTAGGLTLMTYDFAPPDLSAIVRLMVVTNPPDASGVGPVGLSHIFPRAPNFFQGGELRMGGGTGGLRCGYLDSRAFLEDKCAPPFAGTAPGKSAAAITDQSRALVCPLGPLRAGESVAKLFYLVFTNAADNGDRALGQITQQREKLLETSRQYWQQRGTQIATVTTDNARLNDFLAIEKYLAQVQQAAGGGFSPMDRYSYCWIRDSNGPVRYLLSCGDYDAVRRYLDYQFRGYAEQGKVTNNLTLALDLPATAKPIDWSQAPVPSAEIASFMVLQRLWYWQHTADNDLIRQEWPMLRRCLLGQKVDARGTLPFFGDETYRFPGYELFSNGKPAPDWVYMLTRSLDSAMEYVVAARGLAEMAPAAGHSEEAAEYTADANRVQQATEQLFWQAGGFYAPALSDLSDEVQQNPFAPINLDAWWLGYPGDPARLQGNLLQTLRYLSKPNGTVLSTPQVGYYVPLQLGELLHALAATGSPGRDQALQGLLGAAEASGGYAEMNTPEDRPSDAVWGLHRFRPWEGGINAEAVLYALTGLEVDLPRRLVRLTPWLPAGCHHMVVDPICAGKCRLRLEVNGTQCTVTREQDADGQPLSVALGGLAAPVSLATGQSVRTTLAAAPGGNLPARVPFTWTPPTGDRLKPVVLLTWDPRTLAEQGASYGAEMTVVDTKLSWPVAYLRAYLFAPDGSRRARLLVADVAGFPGAFKPREFWTSGEGKKLLDDFQKAGGQVIQLKTDRTPTAESYVPNI